MLKKLLRITLFKKFPIASFNLRRTPVNPLYSGFAVSSFRIVAQSAGVNVKAENTDRTIAETIVIENCR